MARRARRRSRRASTDERESAEASRSRRSPRSESAESNAPGPVGIPVLGAEQQTLDKPVTLGPTASERAGEILSDFLNRPDEIPDDINRQNLASHKRNWDVHTATGPAGDADVPESVREVISSSGRSLDASIQRAVEDRIGDSFGDVRIHTGPNAAAACEDINARAFTVGNHIAFNTGEYDPESQEGQHLLAHELTHVRQQTGAAISMMPQEGVELEIDHDPQLEREAEETAQRVMEGGELGIQRLQGIDVYVQRHPKDDQRRQDLPNTNLKTVAQNGGDPQQTRWCVEKPEPVPGLENTVIWLEESGWNHILARHKGDFIRKYNNIEGKSDIENYVKKAVESPDETRLAKGNKAKITYKITIDNDPFCVIVGSNGYIQTAYPTG